MSDPLALPAEPLTLSEELDAMLSGWLERQARTRGPGRADAVAKAVVCLADRIVAQVEEFCARWDLTVERVARRDAGSAVVTVEGRALPVEGFMAITSMYRP
jgi:hypothetical protein